MLRLALVWICCLALCGGWSRSLPLWRNRESGDLTGKPTERAERQRFLLDLLLQVHRPLLQQELTAMGSRLNEEPSDYQEGAMRRLKGFLGRVQGNKVPRPFGIFSQLDEAMPEHLLGVYRFLVLARDWHAFQRNACYARVHFHPILFVNALQLAVEDRDDTRHLRLPAMYEVLPQLYFEKEVILAAQDVAWQQLTPTRAVSPRSGWMDILRGYLRARITAGPLDKEELMPADPVVIDDERPVAHLSFDVQLSAYWNKLINRLIVSIEEWRESERDQRIVDGDRLMAFRGPADELRFGYQSQEGLHAEFPRLLFSSIEQFVAALTLEDVATGQRSMGLIDPPLITTGGVPFRGSSMDTEGVSRVLNHTIERLQAQINDAVGRDPQSADNLIIAQNLVASQYLTICRDLSLAINDPEPGQPNLLGLATANLRDPIYRALLFRLNGLVSSYEVRPGPRSVSPLQKPSVEAVAFSQLRTFEQIVDTDLINLMDQQLLQTHRNNLKSLRRRLVARQRRLNHGDFHVTLELSAPAEISVQTDLYLALRNQSRPRLHLDGFVSTLAKGITVFQRHFSSSSHVGSSPTMSQLYDADFPTTAGTRSYGLPPHLLLPRGTEEGLKLQLIIELSEPGLENEWPGAVLHKETTDVVIFHH
ncbi:larval serum protein 1 gamma chain [Drosophila obscura]|uniref:larval serum protein 1 gamma chain n=1 Tax=Drosophila obscura TaxID=7282 RepID=UPI001BB10EE7|nr:larval serum protein 1 gamma chain [Drosophila obscura]